MLCIPEYKTNVSWIIEWRNEFWLLPSEYRIVIKSGRNRVVWAQLDSLFFLSLWVVMGDTSFQRCRPDRAFVSEFSLLGAAFLSSFQAAVGVAQRPLCYSANKSVFCASLLCAWLTSRHICMGWADREELGTVLSTLPSPFLWKK